MEEMPAPNRRIKDIIDQTTRGKVLPFVNMLNEVQSVKISQQRVNRLFSRDSRTDAWPTVPIDLLEAILLRFPEVNAYWLVTGKEKSGSQRKPDSDLLTQLRTEIDVLKASLLRLSDLVPSEQEESSIQEVAYAHSGEGKNPLAGKR